MAGCGNATIRIRTKDGMRVGAAAVGRVDVLEPSIATPETACPLGRCLDRNPAQEAAVERLARLAAELARPGVNAVCTFTTSSGGCTTECPDRAPATTGLCLPPGDAALEALGFAVPAPAETTPVLAHLRELPARAVRGELVWFSFDSLCETATAVPDYLALAERFDTLVLDRVPPLAEASADGRQRFANLVDVACDRDARLILIGSDPLSSVPDGQALTRDLDRTTSRLAMLRRPK
ncbi:AFG1/ZapE family ATPase [Streptomyces goshikiensis]|uniref:AFG1/ZapE family ATPase n=1 Tax=Streptomyces goshikiensis TaxID=1942 RepID=UPI00367CA3AC